MKAATLVVFYNPNILHVDATIKQISIPIAVGIRIDANVHFMLLVSLYIVMHVVEHGQCISEKSMVHSAVIQVQPLCASNSLSAVKSVISISRPSAIYDIIISGITISFAGNPKIKAIRITPSSPISLPNGSRNSSQTDSIL